MEDEATIKSTRTPPGPAFFVGAMAVYLLAVHGASLLSADLGGRVPPLGVHPEIPDYVQTLLAGLVDALGHSRAALAALGVSLIYLCMLGLFQLTRSLVKGPLWLGSLAATTFMAHPVKTEVLFEPIGIYYVLSALLAILAVLSYILMVRTPRIGRYLIALGTFTCATLPFSINGGLFGALFLLEFYPATPESRRWVRLFPFLGVAMATNWLHMDVLYPQLPSPDAVVAPLLLLIYPIGLLPETVAHLQANPLIAWGWGIVAVALTAATFIGVKNGPFRVCLLAMLLFRYFPGVEPVDFTTLNGGGQLIFPLALGCVALAGFSRWLMRHEAWGRPTVALTSMLCIVLFVLQFQANRAAATRVDVSPAASERTVNGPGASDAPLE